MDVRELILMNSQKVVTPVKTGVQMVYNSLKKTGFRLSPE
jgi:hypothetical protein